MAEARRQVDVKTVQIQAAMEYPDGLLRVALQVNKYQTGWMPYPENFGWPLFDTGNRHVVEHVMKYQIQES